MSDSMKSSADDRTNLWLLAVIVVGVVAVASYGLLMSAAFQPVLSVLFGISPQWAEYIVLYGYPVLAIIFLASLIIAIVKK